MVLNAMLRDMLWHDLQILEIAREADAWRSDGNQPFFCSIYTYSKTTLSVSVVGLYAVLHSWHHN